MDTFATVGQTQVRRNEEARKKKEEREKREEERSSPANLDLPACHVGGHRKGLEAFDKRHSSALKPA